MEKRTAKYWFTKLFVRESSARKLMTKWLRNSPNCNSLHVSPHFPMDFLTFHLSCCTVSLGNQKKIQLRFNVTWSILIPPVYCKLQLLRRFEMKLVITSMEKATLNYLITHFQTCYFNINLKFCNIYTYNFGFF